MEHKRSTEREDTCKLLILWSGRPGSNRRRPAWEAGILPLNYSRSTDLATSSLYQKVQATRNVAGSNRSQRHIQRSLTITFQIYRHIVEPELLENHREACGHFQV